MVNNESVAASDMRTRNDAELKSLLAEKTEELQKANFKHALGQFPKTSALGALKGDIARLKTILRERALKVEGKNE